MRDELAQQLYTSVQKADEPRTFLKWHASSIAECPRAHYYKRLAIPVKNKVGAGKMLRWKAGHLYEEAIRPFLESVYPDIVSNERLESTELDLTGEYDNYSEKEEMVIEVKTVHDFAMQYRKKGDKRFRLKDDQPYPNHELQNHCYVKLLREKGKPVSSILYVYITLDGRIATYKTPIKPELIMNVEQRLKALNESWATKSPPPCICTDKHFLWKSTMQYCDFKTKENCCSLELLKKGSEEIDPEWNEA